MPNPDQITFTAVRRAYFPGWDRMRLWRLRRVPELNGAQGKCDNRTKTIRVAVPLVGDAGAALLIHEIAHAVTNGGHGTRWQTRMERAAAKAAALGRPALTRLLREQVAGYDDPLSRVSAGLVYQEIADALAEAPDAAFMQVIDWLRWTFGLSRQEFLRRFRRAKAVYNEVREAAEDRAKARAIRMAAQLRSQPE